MLRLLDVGADALAAVVWWVYTDGVGLEGEQLGLQRLEEVLDAADRFLVFAMKVWLAFLRFGVALHRMHPLQMRPQPRVLTRCLLQWVVIAYRAPIIEPFLRISLAKDFENLFNRFVCQYMSSLGSAPAHVCVH